jgi:hypothetical protein
MKGKSKKVEVVKKVQLEPEKVEKVYLVPETKEDYLNLIQCIKDTGSSRVGELEAKASKL